MKSKTIPCRLPRFETFVVNGLLAFGRMAMVWMLTILPTVSAERINHEGRILGPMPTVLSPVLFNTPEADRIMSALQIFPPDSPWNEDVSRRPVLANSGAMIAKITSELASSRRMLRAFFEMNFVLVPDDQPAVPIDFFNYGDESDPSPYPIPANLPVEGWPRETPGLTLAQWQQDINNDGGDRHSIIVQPGTGQVWETWLTKRSGGNWAASNGAKFDLNTNKLRPSGWTSGDAAGLSMFAGLVRYEECERGMVEHAIRIVVKHTRREYIYPATHSASVPSTIDPNVPAMGQRLRLKATFVVPTNWTREEQAVLKALKTYGAIVADNGNFFSISVAPDDRFSAGAFSHLSTVGISDFEVIQTTGPSEGPRSPGAPAASAGPDQTVAPDRGLVLSGFVSATLPVSVAWKHYSGPGAVTFEEASKTNTVARFSAPGDYTLMLSADDGVHAVAHDAVVISVVEGIRIQASYTNGNILLDWSGGNAPFELQSSSVLPAIKWDSVLTTPASTALLPSTGPQLYFRVRNQR